MYRAEVGLAYQDQVINALTQALQAQQQGQDPTEAVDYARQRFVDAEQAMLSTIAFVPPEYDNYVFLANLYNLGGQYLQDKSYYEKAIKIAKRGIEVEPYGPAIRYQYSKALVDTGQAEEAVKQLRYALKMDPRFSDAAVLLATTLKREGDEPAARKVLDDAVAAAAAWGQPAPIDVNQARESLFGTASSNPTTAP